MLVFFFLLFIIIFVVAVEGSEEMQARPVYVAAVDLSCKIS